MDTAVQSKCRDCAERLLVSERGECLLVSCSAFKSCISAVSTIHNGDIALYLWTLCVKRYAFSLVTFSLFIDTMIGQDNQLPVEIPVVIINIMLLLCCKQLTANLKKT